MAENTRPPRHLDDAGKALWKAVVDEYDLEPHQFRILEGASMACDRMHAAAAIVRAEGVTTADRYGVAKAHPAVGIERDARIAMTRCLRELALVVDDVPAGARPPRIRAVS